MLNDDETRSLEALARDPDGCAEAALLADGFTIKQTGLLRWNVGTPTSGAVKGRCFG
jgi:hypothetical protein